WERRDTAERLTRAQELEDHFLAVARLTQDLDAARAHQPEPGGRVPLGEEVLPSRVAVLAGDRGQGGDLLGGQAGEDRAGLEEIGNRLRRHARIIPRAPSIAPARQKPSTCLGRESGRNASD